MSCGFNIKDHYGSFVGIFATTGNQKVPHKTHFKTNVSFIVTTAKGYE